MTLRVIQAQESLKRFEPQEFHGYTESKKALRSCSPDGSGGLGVQVTAVTPHPSNAYFVTASLDKSWAFYDAATATCLSTVRCRGFLDYRVSVSAPLPLEWHFQEQYSMVCLHFFYIFHLMEVCQHTKVQ